VTHTPQQLAEAIAKAAPVRWQLYRPFPTSLVSRTPSQKSQVPVSRDATPTQSLVAPEAPEASQLSVSKRHTEVEPAWQWQALLDIAVWRTRPWWLRVVASLVVKRLGR
jgi:hypothetical protein